MDKQSAANNQRKTLDELRELLLKTVTFLGRPIRKSQLIKYMKNLYECKNKVSEIEFALLSLINDKLLIEDKHFIVTPAFHKEWDGTASAMDEAIVKFIPTLKERIKAEYYFNPFSEHTISCSSLFKYINMRYPFICNQLLGLAYLEYFSEKYEYNICNDFFVELNDYPTDGWFTCFFDIKDCRLLIEDISYSSHNHVFIKLILIPGRGRSYKKAHEQYLEFEKNIKMYFPQNTVHIKTKPLTMIIGTNNYKPR